MHTLFFSLNIFQQALAVSYTNEGMDTQAYLTLERWVNTQYPSIPPPPPSLTKNNSSLPSSSSSTSSPSSSFFSPSSDLHARVTSLFLSAARSGPSLAATRPEGDMNGMVDADVQIGLGVLYYNIAEYDKAVDCFRAAVNARPQDERIWNRLGATLANWGKSMYFTDNFSLFYFFICIHLFLLSLFLGF